MSAVRQEKYYEDEGSDQEGEGEGQRQPGEDEVEAVVARLSPQYSEQAALLPLAMEMRNEASFCDVSFVVNGSMFRAHRVIVRCAIYMCKTGHL